MKNPFLWCLGAVFLVFSCYFWVFTEKPAESFYLENSCFSTKKTERFKLSLDKEKSAKLGKKIDELEVQGRRSMNWDKVHINYARDHYIDYHLVGKDASGKTVSSEWLLTRQPFCFQYYTKSKGGSFSIEHYSIEEFLSPEDKALILELVPIWKEENKKEREERGGIMSMSTYG